MLSQGLWVEETRNREHKHAWTQTKLDGWLKIDTTIASDRGQPQDNNPDVQGATSVAKQFIFSTCVLLPQGFI